MYLFFYMALVAILGRQNVSIFMPTPTNAFVRDVSRIKITSYWAIQTTGILIVILEWPCFKLLGTNK